MDYTTTSATSYGITESPAIVYTSGNTGEVGGFSIKKGFISKIKSFFGEGEQKYNVEDFFQLIKGGGTETNFKKAKDFKSKVLKKYRQAILLGQHQVCKKLAEQSNGLKKEMEIIKNFGNIKYVYEDDVSDLEERGIKDRMIRRKTLNEYKGEIPEEHIEVLIKAKSLKIFDEIIILYTRKKEKEVVLDKKKKTTVKKYKRKVDPIAFGRINSTDRLYFLCDWEDEECDLTIKKLEKEISTKKLL